jgi:tRNA(Ile)-lysidine synthase TilS/MesJ
MAARKTGARTRPFQRLEQELPRNLREFRNLVRKQLNQLEREVEKAERQTRRRAARLLREASHQLGRLEARGESGWRQLAAPYRRELIRLLGRCERAVAPAPRRKKASRKKVTARKTGPGAGKKVTRKKAAGKKTPARKKVTS